jgi:hypothetical protein
MRFSRRGTKPLRILFTLLIGCLFSAQPLLQSHAQSMASATRSDEFDTADRQGGQIGGARMGIHYQLVTMRCGSGEVMVGANIRRRDALNYMQIACATPSCLNTSCTWSSPHWGMSAGSAAGGDAHPAMMCSSNEILSGIRGRVLVFAGRTSFDYAADIEIECSQMKSAPVMGSSGQQLYPISIPGSTGSWHHSDSGFSSAPPGPREVIESNITGPDLLQPPRLWGNCRIGGRLGLFRRPACGPGGLLVLPADPCNSASTKSAACCLHRKEKTEWRISHIAVVFAGFRINRGDEFGERFHCVETVFAIYRFRVRRG